MSWLPLFPLNTVLFPGMPIHLHIFEERYKLMIARCIEERIPFGVVLIKTGFEVETNGPATEAHLVGCTAIITQVQPLGDGRMNIVAVGHERFRIAAQFSNEAYLTGEVDMLPMEKPDSPLLAGQANALRNWLARYLHMLEKVENTEFEMGRFPKDPVALAYLSAAVLRLTPAEKQPLLAESDASRLLTNLTTLFKREVALLEIMADSVSVPEFHGPFSVN
jgi:Lon protease-like protein